MPAAALALIFVCAFLLALAGLRAFSTGIAGYEEKYLSKTAQSLDEMFLPVNPEQILYINIASALIPLLAVTALTGSVVPGIVLGAIGAVIPRYVLSRMKARRMERLEEQLPGALGSLSNSMKAGLSFVQAVEFVAREGAPPLKQELEIYLKEIGLGTDPDQALRNLAGRVKSQDLGVVVTAVLVVKGAGGNLSEMLDRIASTIRDRRTLKGKLNSLTAQGRLQGIVIGSLPLILGFLLYYIEPRMITTLFTDPIGWAIIAAIILFEAIGAFFIRKIVTIEV
jgi:tight adherence protein B